MKLCAKSPRPVFFTPNKRDEGHRGASPRAMPDYGPGIPEVLQVALLVSAKELLPCPQIPTPEISETLFFPQPVLDNNLRS